MNAGIVSLEDGTPCIVYDEKLPHSVSHVSFNEDGYQITLVYSDSGVAEAKGYTFEFPLDPPFAEVLRARGDVALAFMKDRQLVDINIYPVVFPAS